MSSQASRSTASIWAICAGSIIVPLPLDRRAVSSRRRRPDDDRLASLQNRRIAAGELVDAAILAPHGILADWTVFAAGKPERRNAPVPGQNSAFHSFQATDGANDTVARIPAPAAARTLADMKVLEQDGIAEFQYFGIGEPRVGHVGVNGIGTGEAGPGRRAGADRLVVLIPRVAEVQIVHGALRRGHGAERAEQATGHLLRGLDIAGDDGGGKLRRQQ